MAYTFALYEDGGREGDGDGLRRMDGDELDVASLVGVRRRDDALSSTSCSDTDIVGVTGGVGRKLILLIAHPLGVFVGVTITRHQPQRQSQKRRSWSILSKVMLLTALRVDVIGLVRSGHKFSLLAGRDDHFNRASSAMLNMVFCCTFTLLLLWLLRYRRLCSFRRPGKTRRSGRHGWTSEGVKQLGRDAVYCSLR